MEFSAAGLALLKKSEGFREHTYADAMGFPTIGWGHRLARPDSFPNGIDFKTANTLLTVDVINASAAVIRLVKVPLTQGQFDALVDFTFNLGAGRLSGSTLLKKLNKGDYDGAAEELLRWDHGVEAGKEVELAALQARREAEYDLWYFQEAA